MSDGDVRNFRKFIHLSEFGSRQHDHITSCAGSGRQRQYVVEDLLLKYVVEGLLVKKVSKRSSYCTVIVRVILLIPWILCKKSPQRREYDMFKGWYEDWLLFWGFVNFAPAGVDKEHGRGIYVIRSSMRWEKDWSSGGCSGCRPCAPALTTSSKGHLWGSPIGHWREIQSGDMKWIRAPPSKVILGGAHHRSPPGCAAQTNSIMRRNIAMMTMSDSTST